MKNLNEIELWVQCLHAVNKKALSMVGNSTFSFMYQYKKYWSARHICASNIRNYLTHVHYAATNQIPFFHCILIDVILIIIITWLKPLFTSEYCSGDVCDHKSK